MPVVAVGWGGGEDDAYSCVGLNSQSTFEVVRGYIPLNVLGAILG